ncbi:pep_M12B_propep domain-containing protein [Trichonephila clavipes]|nr:pep_M12B_propep domain-containing protein [Trichonephila clavipes]
MPKNCACLKKCMKASQINIDDQTGDIHLSHGDYVIYPFSYNESSFQQHHLSLLQHPDPDRPWRPLLAEDIHFCDVKADFNSYFAQRERPGRFIQEVQPLAPIVQFTGNFFDIPFHPQGMGRMVIGAHDLPRGLNPLSSILWVGIHR